MVDLPDFSDLLKRIAGSTEKIAGKSPRESETEPGVLAVNNEREDSPKAKRRSSNVRSVSS